MEKKTKKYKSKKINEKQFDEYIEYPYDAQAILNQVEAELENESKTKQ